MDKYIDFDLNIKKTVAITQFRTGDKMNKTVLIGLWIVLISVYAGFIATNSAFGTDSDTISFESLLEEMVDRDCLGRLFYREGPLRSAYEDISIKNCWRQ